MSADLTPEQRDQMRGRHRLLESTHHGLVICRTCGTADETGCDAARLLDALEAERRAHDRTGQEVVKRGEWAHQFAEELVEAERQRDDALEALRQIEPMLDALLTAVNEGRVVVDDSPGELGRAAIAVAVDRARQTRERIERSGT